MKAYQKIKEIWMLLLYACKTLASDIWFLHFLPLRRFARLQGFAFEKAAHSLRYARKVLKEDLSSIACQFESLLDTQQETGRNSCNRSNGKCRSKSECRFKNRDWEDFGPP